MFGNKDIYCLGLIENIDLINKKYNDWKIYVYYENIPCAILDILTKKSNTYLFECKHKNNIYESLLWRLYPLETDIDILISRDADSRITDREIKFVNDWIISDKVFHIIRDNYKHRWPILAGMFGIKVKEFNKLYTIKSIDTYINFDVYNMVVKKKEKTSTQCVDMY